MTTVEALKNLAAAILGAKSEKIPGTTIAEVVQYMADNYKAPKAK